jgi:hypothetical protein
MPAASAADLRECEGRHLDIGEQHQQNVYARDCVSVAQQHYPEKTCVHEMDCPYGNQGQRLSNRRGWQRLAKLGSASTDRLSLIEKNTTAFEYVKD